MSLTVILARPRELLLFVVCFLPDAPLTCAPLADDRCFREAASALDFLVDESIEGAWRFLVDEAPESGLTADYYYCLLWSGT